MSGLRSSVLGTALAVSAALAWAGAAMAQDTGAQVTEIDWAEAQADARQQLASTPATTARLPQSAPAPANASAQDFQSVRLPVLIPRLNGAKTGLNSDQDGFLFFPRGDSYVASMAVEDILIEVYGSRRIHAEIADPAAARRLRAGQDASGYRIAETEGGQTVSFSRYGAAYSVTLECAVPRSQPRCSDPQFARAVANALIIAGGSPEDGP